MAEWRSEWIVGERHPNYNSVELDCEVCGKTFEVRKSDQDYRKHCSYECKGIAGRTEEENYINYGSGWREQSEKRRELDGYECQVCGMSQEEHMAWCGIGLHVHHIQKFESFEEAEVANRIENLITLCAKCHGRWEGIPLRPQ
jgi:hypothetical protein